MSEEDIKESLSLSMLTSSTKQVVVNQLDKIESEEEYGSSNDEGVPRIVVCEEEAKVEDIYDNQVERLNLPTFEIIPMDMGNMTNFSPLFQSPRKQEPDPMEKIRSQISGNLSPVAQEQLVEQELNQMSIQEIQEQLR